MNHTDKPFYLYHLLDRRGRVRYVGISVRGEKRLNSHLCDARTGRLAPRPLIVWMRAELAKDRIPKIRVIRKLGADYLAAEQREIHRQLKRGAKLLNAYVQWTPTQIRNVLKRMQYRKAG